MAKLRYILLGGGLMLVGALMSSIVIPNSDRLRLGHIECTGLDIVDESGKSRIALGNAYGGYLILRDNNNDISIILNADSRDSYIRLANGTNSAVKLGIDNEGGLIFIQGKKEYDSVVLSFLPGAGGVIGVRKNGELKSALGVKSNGKGLIYVDDNP